MTLDYIRKLDDVELSARRYRCQDDPSQSTLIKYIRDSFLCLSCCNAVFKMSSARVSMMYWTQNASLIAIYHVLIAG